MRKNTILMLLALALIIIPQLVFARINNPSTPRSDEDIRAIVTEELRSYDIENIKEVSRSERKNFEVEITALQEKLKDELENKVRRTKK